MKLRNKKTGEITGDYSYILLESTHYKTYHSLAKLNEEWEDYKPAEPLIKDEKIRKAVRAWAEANERDLFRVINDHFNCCKIIGYGSCCDKIEFSTTIAGANKDYYYTIAELCGEEKE